MVDVGNIVAELKKVCDLKNGHVDWQALDMIVPEDELLRGVVEGYVRHQQVALWMKRLPDFVLAWAASEGMKNTHMMTMYFHSMKVAPLAALYVESAEYAENPQPSLSEPVVEAIVGNLWQILDFKTGHEDEEKVRKIIEPYLGWDEHSELMTYLAEQYWGLFEMHAPGYEKVTVRDAEDYVGHLELTLESSKVAFLASLEVMRAKRRSVN